MRNGTEAARRKPIFIQVAEKIISDLRGSAMPGDALPGERQLAQRYKISRGTVVSALDHLAAGHLVERLPARGTFLTDEFLSGTTPRRILLPYPEPRISPEFLHPELWGISSEIQRGMLDEAMANDCAVVFQHFKEPESGLQLAGQLRRVEEYDGAVFIGMQLSTLRDGLVAAGKPCVMVAPPVLLSRFPNISMVSFEMEYCFEQLAGLLADHGYTTLAAVLPSELRPLDRENDMRKLESLAAAAARHGISLDRKRIFEIPIGSLESNAQALLEQVRPPLKGSEAMFCMRTDYVDAVYHLAAAGKLKFRDFPFFGFATGVTFMNLTPRPTYVKIGYHQMGRAAAQAVFEAWKEPSSGLVRKLVMNELVDGETI